MEPVPLSRYTLLIAAVAGLTVIAVLLLTEPLPQDPAYHQFSDQRTIWGVTNFWDVVSNLPFLIVGGAGLVLLWRHTDAVCMPGAAAAYWVFFVGIVLTAFGSAYYHLDPSNERLVWDRLPMTIGFAGLFTIIVAEFVDAALARRLLLPMLLVGLGSVVYWAYTETQGNGDLRPYALVQFLPMLLIPGILLSHSSPLGVRRYYWWMLAWYVLAKIFEHFDPQIFAAGQLLSGHSLKHIAAAMTPAVFLVALRSRLFT